MPDADVDARIRAYHADRSWLEAVERYSGIAARELEAAPAARPASAAGVSPALRAAREVVRLEQMARREYKRALHREWLEALPTVVRPGAPFHVLDYGCGVSSFGALALELPEVHATLAEASVALLGYLRWNAAQRSDGRLRVVALPARPSGYGSAARLRVDPRAIRESFDAIVLADVLEHTVDPLRVLVHLLTRLRPGGLVFVNYPSEIDGDWHTPEAFHQRTACFQLLRICTRQQVGHARRLRAGPLPRLALLAMRVAEPVLRRASRRFARRVFAERGAALVARVREAGREISVGELLADV